MQHKLTPACDESDSFPSTDGALTGPPHHSGPITRQERISSIDVLRGVALMGILLMNIDGFGMPAWTNIAPLGTRIPVLTGPHAHLNTIIWSIRWIFFEGQMRGLFSMLFGAGVILLTCRAEKRGEGHAVADIFLRRNMWLVVIGLVHAYLIWFADILVPYGMTALLFLYPCRKLRLKALVGAGLFALLVVAVTPMSAVRLMKDIALSKKAAATVAAEKLGQVVTETQLNDQKTWQHRLAEWKPDEKTIMEDYRETRAGYISVQTHRAPWVTSNVSSISLEFGDVLGMMLIGMALVKNGFLTAKLSYKTYAVSVAIGYLVSVPLGAIGAWRTSASGFDLITAEKWLLLPYELRRTAGTVATAALIIILVKSGIFPSVMKRIAAVGQTALSNYLLTSIVCELIFIWGPYKLYERLQFYQSFYVVAAVWAINLIWSSLWLQNHRIGPAEWAWRSLTYWKKQPMRSLRGQSELCIYR